MRRQTWLWAWLLPLPLVSPAEQPSNPDAVGADRRARAAEQCGSVVIQRCNRSLQGAPPIPPGALGFGREAAPALQAQRWAGEDELEDIVITAQGPHRTSIRKVFEANLGLPTDDKGPDVTYQGANGVRCTKFHGRTYCSDPQAGTRMRDSNLPATNFNDLVF